jgi:hypothetical protein
MTLGCRGVEIELGVEDDVSLSLFSRRESEKAI